jgi:hypothetical protein
MYDCIVWVHLIKIMQLHKFSSARLLVVSGDRCQRLSTAACAASHCAHYLHAPAHSTAHVGSALKYALTHILLHAN